VDSAEVLHLDSAALLPLQRFTVRPGNQLGLPSHSDGRPEFFVCDSGSDMVFEWMGHAKPSSATFGQRCNLQKSCVEEGLRAEWRERL
jgi:hypothetical protein